MNWKEHTKHAAQKGLAAYEALSRITTSTWGPSMRRSRLIYTAVVRPTMLYGAQVWALRDNGEPAASSLLQPLTAVQNRCLRRITGGYKRTPIAALEREAQVPPLDLYTDTIALQRATATKDHPVNRNISDIADGVWNQVANNHRLPNTTWLRRRSQCGTRPRPPTGKEKLWERAVARQHDATELEGEGRRRTSPTRGRRRRQEGAGRRRTQSRGSTLIARWARWEWRRRWSKAAEGKKATTWRNPWDTKTLPLYEGLPKHQATALFLLRTEVLGLNAWLTSVRVPDILPRCVCGWEAQTVRHVLLHCPDYEHSRPDLIQQTGTEDLQEMLSKPESAKAAARWFARCGVLEQFKVAKEIEEEDATKYMPFQELDSWL